MERSVIWDGLTPGYAALHPGYQVATSLAPVARRDRTTLISLGIQKLVRFAKIRHRIRQQPLFTGIIIPWYKAKVVAVPRPSNVNVDTKEAGGTPALPGLRRRHRFRGLLLSLP